MIDRRTFLRSAGVTGALGVTGLAGCLGSDDGEEDGTPEDNAGERERFINGQLNFLMSPTEPQDEMEAQYQPVADHLSEETGVDVDLTYSRNYSAVISALDAGTGDVGEMGPFAAALGVRADSLDIVLQRYAYGSWDYASVIVTREDTDIDSLEDLSGKTIAFADRLSSSGSLYPLYMLKQAGLDIGELPENNEGAEFDATFSGHAAAFEQLDKGQADAAGVGMFIAVVDGDEERGEYKDGIVEVGKEDGIPRAPIAVSPRLDEDDKEAVADAFLNAPDKMYHGADGEEGTDDDIWFSDVREADASTYEPVIEVARELNIESDLLDEEIDEDE